jgi:hypothetical protein
MEQRSTVSQDPASGGTNNSTQANDYHDKGDGEKVLEESPNKRYAKVAFANKDEPSAWKRSL